MTTDNKEQKILDKIAKAMTKLEADLKEVDALNEPSDKKHEFKKWYAEKKAIHEIKKVLHEAGKYEKYDEKELDKIAEYFSTIGK